MTAGKPIAPHLRMMGLQLPNASVARLRWESARPFPHVLIPNAITPEDAEACGAEFPPPGFHSWRTFTGSLEAGKQDCRAELAGPKVASLHTALASETFMVWLRFVTDHADLVVDPDRLGGGIHQSGPGARLGTHVDFNRHAMRPELIRAVNTILFVGDEQATGGDLYLGAVSDQAAKVVPPTPGTLVIFEASDTSWHGHPIPMPMDTPLRKSIPAYFYRLLRSDERVVAHSTRFLDNLQP